ncbi:MAG: hypothetical protein DMF85_01445, partial [Acidobacteria bacterium]
MITRCDLKRAFHLNIEDREYATWPLQTYPSPEEPHMAVRQQHVVREPTVLVETETVDTGERKELFGRTARHVITTRRVTSLGRAKQAPGKTVTDGWYIDLDTSISCDPSWRPVAYGRAFLVTRKPGEQW